MLGFGSAGQADGFGGGGPSFTQADNFIDEAFGGSSARLFSEGGGGNEDLFGPLSEEEANHLARTFEQARGPDGFVPAEEGRHQLQRTGLNDHMLQNIWNLSDLDRDGRLSLREFVCALHIAEQARRGRRLPTEVRPEQQERLARSVEGFLAGLLEGGPEAAKHPRHEDFSTVDTAPSEVPGGHRKGRTRKHQDGDRSDTDRGFSSGLEFDSTLGARRSEGPADSELSTFASRGGARGSGLGLDSPSAQGQPLRGRESAARALGPTAEGTEGLGPPASRGGLGQLASVFELVARLDAGGELRRLSSEVLEERRELERQLSRRREFERQLRESRGQLDALREERRQVEGDTAAAQRRIAHLQDELGFVEREVRAAEEELRALRESSGLSGEGRRGPAPYSSAEDERRDVISKVRAERELLQRDQKGIEELRVRLDDIFKQKLDAQLVQQSLLEKQRQSEQDRGLMLTAIEAERGKLSAMRAERIKLWEERSLLEREMMDIAQERWLAENQAAPERRHAEAPRGPGVPQPGALQASQAEAQRPRGVRQEDLPPAVVFGGLPEERDGPCGGIAGLGSGLRRPTGDGFLRSDAYRPEAQVRDRGMGVARADTRGVRNDGGSTSGGWYSFGGGSPAGLSTRSQHTATFGGSS
mmetsp:Transcript_27321/g.84905  ORF Transcript_27321/g.84905 Transcript_27321/m.84905 type:complete len:647 (-) Transcript_27321:59-1999(-)